MTGTGTSNLPPSGTTGTAGSQQQQKQRFANCSGPGTGASSRSSSTEHNGTSSSECAFTQATCLYAVLGIQKTATESDIKKAYHRLALRWHPDKNPERKDRSERMFKRIAQAYEVLSDEKRRSEYDKYGLRGVGLAQSNSTGSGGRTRTTANRERRRTTAFYPGSFGGGSSFFTGFRSPFDIFREFFGDPLFSRDAANDPFFAPPSSFFIDPLEEMLFKRNMEFRNANAHLFGNGGAAPSRTAAHRPARHSTGNTGTGTTAHGVASHFPASPTEKFKHFVGKDENKCEFSSVIRFSKSAKDPDNKLKKTTTTARLVDGKRIVTKKIEDDGEETLEVLENGILKSRLINGHPVVVTAV